LIGRLFTKNKMSITVAIEPPGYRKPNVKAALEIGYAPVMAFYGDCMGVALVNRDPAQLHLSFVMLYEDDGWWYESKGNPIDSHWMPEMIEVLQEAHRWVKAHARKSKDGCGWEAKK
jgi:hypothetical protein